MGGRRPCSLLRKERGVAPAPARGGPGSNPAGAESEHWSTRTGLKSLRGNHEAQRSLCVKESQGPSAHSWLWWGDADATTPAAYSFSRPAGNQGRVGGRGRMILHLRPGRPACQQWMVHPHSSSTAIYTAMSTTKEVLSSDVTFAGAAAVCPTAVIVMHSYGLFSLAVSSGGARRLGDAPIFRGSPQPPQPLLQTSSAGRTADTCV